MRPKQYTAARLVLIGLALVAFAIAFALHLGWLAGDPNRYSDVSLLMDVMLGIALITLACVIVDVIR